MASVNISAEPGPYKAGDTIKGTITVSTPTPKSGCTLRCNLAGQAIAKVYTYNGSSATTVTRTEQLVDQRVLMVRDIVIPAGDSHYPFMFKIAHDEDLPSTVKFSLGASKLTIAYSIRGSLEGLNGELSCEANFVYHGRPFDGRAVVKHKIGQVTRLCCFGLGSLTLDLKMPSDQVFMGSELKFSLAINASQCSVDISGVNAEIVRVITGKPAVNCLASETAADTIFNFHVEAGSKGKLFAAVKIPALKYGSAYSSALDYEYTLVLTPTFSSFACSGPSVSSCIKINHA